MVQALPVRDTIAAWVDVCPLSAILPNTGVCALVKGQHVAIFRVGDGAEL